MTIARTIINDLREKRLWPVAVALLVAVIAVPVLLSSSSSSTTVPLAQLPSQAGSQPPVQGIPAVAVTNAASNARINGPSRDPFIQHQASSQVLSTGGGVPTTSSAPTGSTVPSTPAIPTGSTPPSTSTAPGTAVTPTIPTSTAQAVPAGLTDTQSYTVGYSITTKGGGVHAIDAPERLTVLPNDRNPWLIELGVLKGGRRVLFAVQPGTTVKGRGTCTPGPIDCQVLALAPNEIETLSGDVRSGQIVSLSSDAAQASAPPATSKFAVTAINADDHPSVAAAEQVRHSESAAGRALLDKSSMSALSLFRYDSSIGTIVDLRNVTTTVLGADGQQASVPGSTSHVQAALRAQVQLLPQGMASMLRTGIVARLTTNERVTGFVTMSIPRSAARHAGIPGHSRSVVIGRGTVSQVKKGTVKLHLRLSHTVARKLKHLSHIALTVRLALVSPSGDRLTIDAAGRY